MALARAEAGVWLLARDRHALEEAAAAASRERPGGPAPKIVPVDLASDDDLRRVARDVERDGGLDVLVHCAAMYVRGALAAADPGDLDQLFRVNVRGPLVLTQALLPALRARRGSVVFMNSSVGRRSAASVGLYAATKHGLRAIADSLREEVNSEGIRVLSVFLGRVAGPLQERIHAEEGRAYRPGELIQPEDVAATVLHALALPPSAELTELDMRPRQKPR